MKPVLETLREQATSRPDRLLLSIDGQAVTREAFLERVARTVAFLRHQGVSAGDAVGIILPNSLLWAELYWAISAIGGIPVPFDPQVGEWELRQLLAITSPVLCVAVSRFRSNEPARSLLALQPEFPALRKVIVADGPLERDAFAPDRSCVLREPLVYACTSGTTGASRVIVVPHQGFLRSQLDMAAYLGLGPQDVMLLGMPLYHQGGFGMGLQAILAGGAAAYQSRFEPEAFLRAAQDLGATVLQLSPTQAKILLGVPNLASFDLSRVRLAYFAGEVLPDEVARALWADRGIRVVNVIGSSETATMVVWDSACDADVSPSVFRELPFTRVRLASVTDPAGMEPPLGEAGDIRVRTDAVVTSYLGNPAENAARIFPDAEGRWFATGDLGLRLPDGRVRFVGRAKRVIKRGANLVYPEEVESFLLTHPDIAAVAVLKEEHELFGEAIVAHIQPNPGVTLTRGDILRFCRGELAAYKVPDTVLVTREIPTGIGKVQYKYIRSETKESP